MPRAALIVDGMKYEGWQTISVSRSIRAISGRFELGVTEVFPGSPGRWPIFPGSACKVTLDGYTVISGHIDSRSAAFDEGSHNVSVSGRDKTADMVDSAPNIGTYELLGLTALQIGAKLAAPFGVSISSAVAGLKKLDRFDIQPGETAYECLDRACSLSGVFATGQVDGTILLSRASTRRALTSLKEGVNVKSASYEANHENRFRTYIVGGQHFGNNELFGEDASGVEGRATDPNIRAPRTAYIRTSSNLSAAQAGERAAWEAANRLANSNALSVIVQGWQQVDGGPLWEINTVVPVDIPTLGISGNFVISDIDFTQNESGTITSMKLAPPGSFTPSPEVPESGSSSYAEYF